MKMKDVLTGLTCSISNLNISSAHSCHPVKRAKYIPTLTKPSVETSNVNQNLSNGGNVCQDASLKLPTATAGVCTGAGPASSVRAPGPRTARRAVILVPSL